MSAAIDDVFSLEDKLVIWGRWLRTTDNPGIGCSRVNVLYKMMRHGQPIRSMGSSQTPDDDIAEQVDIAVQAMTLYKPKQAKALRMRYKNLHWTDEQCARELKISRRTFQYWLADGRGDMTRLL